VRELFRRLDVGELSCFALRGATEEPAVRADLDAVGVSQDDLVSTTHGDTNHIAGLIDRHRDLAYGNADYALPRGLRDA
jgi:hypothetical protein